MHINVSYCAVKQDDKTDYMPFILGGIMKHIEEITYYFNPTENSYERLGECKAPKYICWGRENRSALIRVPSSKEPRFEIRSPDPSCNPYLAYALVIYAAIDGIRNKIAAPAAVEENLFGRSAQTATQQLGLKLLPDTVEAARTLAENSSFVKDALGF